MAKGECRARHNRIIFTRDLGGDFAERRSSSSVDQHLAYLYPSPLSFSITCPCLTSRSLPLASPSPSLSFHPRPRPREIRPSGLFQCTEAFVISYQFVIQKREDERAAGQIALLLLLLHSLHNTLSPMPKRPSSFRVTYGELPCFFLPSFLSSLQQILTFPSNEVLKV